MKFIKSSLGDLRRMFSRTVTLRDIAEPLVSFDAAQPAAEIRAFMEAQGFDVVGVREGGLVSGYARRTVLSTGLLGDHQQPFADEDVLPDGDPLLAAFARLCAQRQVFISVLGQVGGIVTRGDLQKAPVRLWLFGLVSLLEMQLLRLVRERHPGESWAQFLSDERVEGARRVFAERQRRREENDLPDCLQLGDKAAIFMKDPELVALSGFPSKRALATFFNEVGNLRNALAHAGGIQHQRWPEQAALVTHLEELLEKLEVAQPPAR